MEIFYSFLAVLEFRIYIEVTLKAIQANWFSSSLAINILFFKYSIL